MNGIDFYGLSGSIASYLPEPRNFIKSVGQRFRDMFGAIGPIMEGGAADLGTLLQEQVQVQLQMQVYSSLSNIEKSKHDMAMTPIRNFKVS